MFGIFGTCPFEFGNIWIFGDKKPLAVIELDVYGAKKLSITAENWEIGEILEFQA